MAQLVKRDTPVEVGAREPVDLFGPIDRLYDRFFGTWPTPWGRDPLTTTKHWLTDRFIPVNEFHRDGKLVIRAEMPGIDPDRDVEVTVSGGVLRISAHRRTEEDVDEKDYIRKEMRYGSFERSMALPEGVSESDVEATYRDGILEITVPEARVEATRVAITKK